MAVNWVDGVLGGTPLTASNLNAMDLANPTSAAAIAASLAYESKGLSTATLATLTAAYVGKGTVTINVTDYGAVGDGVTDDTTALLSAFSAARAVSGVLQFSFGKTYIVSGSLNPTGVDVRGCGATLQVKAGTTPTYSAVLAPTNRFIVSDLTIDLNKANTTDPGSNTQGNGIYLFNAAGWTGLPVVRNVTVINGYQCGMRFGTASTPTDALSVPLSRVLVDSPRVDSTKYGIWLGYVRGATVTNPAISNTVADGITELVGRDTQIIGGRVSATGGHGVVTQYSNGFSCQGVSVDGATNMGIVVGGGSTTIVEAKYFTISGNRVTNCTQNGISVDTTKTGSPGTVVPTYSTVSGNVSRGNGIHGIYVHNGQHVAVTGNTCQGNGNGGLAMDSKNVAVSGNVFAGNAYGIKFQGTTSGYGDHQIGRNVVVGSTTADLYYDAHGADGTTLDLQGSGSPETVVAAPVGSRFSRSDGGASTTLYVKESGAGNTGWVAK